MSTEVLNTAHTERPRREDWLKVEHESTPRIGYGYRLHLLITKESDGSFSAVVLNLPGTGSCGDTEEMATENAKEAARGVLEVYEQGGEEIPWTNTYSADIPAGSKQKWIILDD